MKKPQITNCGDCLFFVSIEEVEHFASEGYGECRFRAPMVDPYDRDHCAIFPVMNKRQGCGSGVPLVGAVE